MSRDHTTTIEDSLFEDANTTDSTTLITEDYPIKAHDFGDILPTEVKREDEIDLRPSDKTELQCNKCNEAFSKLSFLAIHNRSHSTQAHFTCPECQGIFHTLNELSNHCQKHSLDQIVCPKCSEKFKDSRLFKMHIEIHIIDMEGDQKEERVSEIEDDIDRNLLYHDILFLAENLNPPVFANINTELFPCQYCSIHFTSHFRLSIHKLTHTRNKLLSNDDSLECVPFMY